MRRFDRGFVLLGRFRGAPIRVHWTAPLGAFVFGRFAFVPAFWVSFLGLILIHELGHAVAVRWCRATVTSIDLDGAGGLCHWRGQVPPMKRAFIAWGGVLGQLVVFLVAAVVLAVFGAPSNVHLAQVADVCTRANLWLAAFNLLPIGFLDGAKAWAIVPLLLERAKRRASAWRRERVRRRAFRGELAEFERMATRDDPTVASDVRDTLARVASEVNESPPRRSEQRDPEA